MSCDIETPVLTDGGFLVAGFRLVAAATQHHDNQDDPNAAVVTAKSAETHSISPRFAIYCFIVCGSGRRGDWVWPGGGKGRQF